MIKTINLNLKFKILAGYLLITMMSIVVGLMARHQFSKISDSMTFLTKDIASEVKIANKLCSAILSTRSFVEKYLYLNHQEDRREAEFYIKKVESLLDISKKVINSPKRFEPFHVIDNLSKKYFVSYKKIVKDMELAEQKKQRIVQHAKTIRSDISILLREHREDEQRFEYYINIFNQFVEIEQNISVFISDPLVIVKKESHARLSALNSLLQNSDQQKAKQLPAQIEKYRSEIAVLNEIRKRIKNMIERTLIPLAPKMEMLAINVADYGWNEVDVYRDELNETVKVTDHFIIGVITITILLGICLGLILSRLIIKPISYVVEGLTASVEEVEDGSNRVSTLSNKLADRSLDQANGIKEKAESLKNISDISSQNAHHARDADNLVSEANQVIMNANKSIGDLNAFMKDIRDASEQTSQIIKTIDEIAFQTNLLALNAAVEAARAGEAGAGFAVVADEVRNLALRSAQAAGTTEELIQSIVDKIHGGTSLGEKTTEAFVEVTSRVSGVGDLISSISVLSKDQAEAIEKLSESMNRMEEAVQQNVDNANDSASASGQMTEQVDMMKDYVDQLVDVIEGNDISKIQELEEEVHEQDYS
ncbi:methyl-accepting chemotaxis sensory transducer protein [Candidatus Magnetomorum sp. HK-1]|nr:methyl-accepting chemotaxis sensory transducer protein [Candidatus Magnetomorum sp. HK-1]